ncbi:LysR family transcriptional regulator [Microvirga sp. KLBC 81]|uniref:LysR family transcriptional regulator n=1 Tax=Microvirga sp. KLBC 81 TaxID=1862707 RepID=UPI000D50AC72|nr:LysR family transcriptional regulator [Microvirga sp. KLBC 81]PVE25641.1 LysR family transcriptional regulator [Microvirga sp. KLBC 81]
MTSLRRSLPSMNALFTLEAAARCGNFSRAADELNVTPAAVSRMISRVEEHLGIKLFYRMPSGAALTEEGKLLFDSITRGFTGIEAAIREIKDRQNGMETVTLSVSTGFTTHWLMPRMGKFKAAFPSVDLRFQLLNGPLGGPVDDVDLGMRFVSGSDERHEAVFVMPEILLPICTPLYLEQHIREEQGAEVVAGTVVNLSNAQPDWSGLFSPRRGGEALNSLIFSDYAVVVQAALLGQGVALGWLNVVAHWLRTKALVPARLDLMKTERLCHLVRARARPHRPIVYHICDWIISELHEDLAEIAKEYPMLNLEAELRRSP